MELIEYLRTLRTVSDQEAALIVNAFERRRYVEGDILFSAGRLCRHLYFICKGVVRIVSTTEAGVEVTHYFLKENYFCNILYSFWQEEIAREGIQAATETEVVMIGKTRLLQLYEQLPWLKELIERIAQQTLLQKIQFKNSFQGLDATSRYRLFWEKMPDVAASVPLGYVASYLDITPQSLSRIRKSLL